MRKVVTIAGSDSCGGAGIQADIKTITAHKLYAMSVVTAVTAQNTMGVNAVYELSPELVLAQIDAVFEDIYPDSVKIGMVSNAELIRVIAQGLRKHRARNIVVDPVMVATSGGRLMRDDAVQTLVDELFPIATLITPNIPEAEVLSGRRIRNVEDMEAVLLQLSTRTPSSILLKGGHLKVGATDILATNGSFVRFEEERVPNPNTHGTGCTLSSAIACGLAEGLTLERSIERAKRYVTGAIGAMLALGHGSGPINHMYDLMR